MRFTKLAMAGLLSLALMGAPRLALAADDSLTVKNATLSTVTICSKDTGGGVMASCAALVDAAGAKISPMPKTGGLVGVLPDVTGGCTPHGLSTAASTNATSVKSSAGLLCGGRVLNTTYTTYCLRLYNLASPPTPSSASGWLLSVAIAPSLGGAGTPVDFGPFGASFSTGIAYVVTGGCTSTDATSAAAGLYVTLGFK